MADNYRYIPGVPKAPPPKTEGERLKEAQLAALYELANDEKYQRELAANRAFTRMVDLVEGKAVPHKSDDT